MAKKDDIKRIQLANRKRIRNLVRLETSIIADNIIDDLVDEAEVEFDRRVLEGEPFVLIDYQAWITEAVRERFRLLELYAVS